MVPLAGLEPARYRYRGILSKPSYRFPGIVLLNTA